jgi:hypothetical protein
VRHTVATRANCKCTDKNSILAVMLQKMKSNSKLSDPARIKLINEYWRETRNGTKLGRICYNHVQFTAAKMGLKTRSLNLISLLDALQVLFRRKSHWGTIQGDPVTSILFTSAFRGVRQHQDLRSYRYRPANVRTQIDWKAVRKAMGLDKVYDLFKETGTVCLPLFDFAVEDEELMKIVNESFKMYQYHTRCIDGASNLGWNRVMFHSGVQQLVRGDPLYWLMYAMLREEPNLISYPYYTKYTHSGDSTFFRHIDLNISDAVGTGKGVELIQGSVSWDDEDDQNCTEVLSGFHKIFDQYYEWRKNSGIADCAGKIEGWDDAKHWPEECQKRWPGVKWEKIVCSAGEVRISDPRIVHGSTGPATKDRRTVLPWFVKVSEDMATMEIPEMGSYAEIAMAHLQLTAAPKTPSGHANMYGGIKWAFPGDVGPIFSSPISRAINCQVRWDSGAVQTELERLFSVPNKKTIDDWVHATRQETVKMVKAH